MKPDASVSRIWLAQKGWGWSTLVVALVLSLAGFNRPDAAAAGPDPAADQPFISRAEVRQQGAVTVRAATLTDDESEHYFGASLADHGIQTVWVSVDNAGEWLLHFLPIVTDQNYFSAAEVEQLLHAWWRGSANTSIMAAVARSQMPETIPQKQTVTGAP
jgi:hypothetical protein